MPLLRINATQTGFMLHDSPQCTHRRVTQMVQGDRPVILMIHGYKYQPSHPQHCPHDSLFGAASPVSWPRRLQRADAHGHTTLCIAFGWGARGGLRQMHARASEAGQALAALISLIRTAAPQRLIHIIAHSLGSEVALSALPHLQHGDINRMILLTGATHRAYAHQMLSTAAGQSIQAFNVITRENDLFDLAFERFVPGDGAIGRGISGPNTVNLQLDCPESLSVLAGFGFPIAPPQSNVSHWSSYTRPGTMAFYAHALHNPDCLTLSGLKMALPTNCAPRYARLLPIRPALARFALVPFVKRRIMGTLTHKGRRNEHAY